MVESWEESISSENMLQIRSEKFKRGLEEREEIKKSEYTFHSFNNLESSQGVEFMESNNISERRHMFVEERA